MKGGAVMKIREKQRLNSLAREEEQPERAPMAARRSPTMKTLWPHATGDLQALQHAIGNRATSALLAQKRNMPTLLKIGLSHPRENAILTWPWRRGRANLLQRFSIPRTPTTDPYWDRVPDAHLPRVRAAVRILEQKIRQPRLITYFRDHAPGGTENTLQQVANRAKIWELRTPGSLGLSEEGGDNMAYDTFIYRLGRWQIAATLLHEMGHLAGFRTEEECENAIDAGYVYAPFIQSVNPTKGREGTLVTISGISFGPRQERMDRVTFGGVDAGRVVSWQWTHAGQGQIRVRVPQGARSGPIVVENNRIPSNGVPFQVIEGSTTERESET